VPEPLPAEQPAPVSWAAPARRKVLWIAAGASLLLGTGALVFWRSSALPARAPVPAEAAGSVAAATAAPARAETSVQPAQPPRVVAAAPASTIAAKPAASSSESARPRSSRSSRHPERERAERPSKSAEQASPQKSAQPHEPAQARQEASAQAEQPTTTRAAAPVPAPVATPVRSASAPIDREPVAVRRTKPEFPARARRMRLDRGRVTAELGIDRNGVVQNATVVDADPKGVFDEAVLKAVRNWSYRPKIKAGVPVDARVRVTIQFVEE